MRGDREYSGICPFVNEGDALTSAALQFGGRTGSEYRAATVLLLPGAIVPVRHLTGLLAGASTLRACPDEHRPVPWARTTHPAVRQWHLGSAFGDADGRVPEGDAYVVAFGLPGVTPDSMDIDAEHSDQEGGAPAHGQG